PESMRKELCRDFKRDFRPKDFAMMGQALDACYAAFIQLRIPESDTLAQIDLIAALSAYLSASASVLCLALHPTHEASGAATEAMDRVRYAFGAYTDPSRIDRFQTFMSALRDFVTFSDVMADISASSTSAKQAVARVAVLEEGTLHWV